MAVRERYCTSNSLNSIAHSAICSVASGLLVLQYDFYQHVVHVDLHIPPNLTCEHLVHWPLIHGVYVLEFEWHHFVTKEALTGNERSFFLIGFIHHDLVVSRECIHETQ